MKGSTTNEGRTGEPLAKSVVAEQRLASVVAVPLSDKFSRGERECLDRLRELRRYPQNEQTEITLMSGESVRIGDRFRKTGVNFHFGRFLFSFVRQLRPETSLELGTGLGSSGMFHLAAMEMNGVGHMTTIEAHEATAQFARRMLESISPIRFFLTVGFSQDLLSEVLTELKKIDYAFIDGHHREESTKAYFHQILPFMSTNSLMVFDDIDWSDGMVSAWSHISGHSEVAAAADLGRMGVCLIRPD